MQKVSFLLLSLFLSISSIAQVTLSDFEKYPVFPECDTTPIAELPNCFNRTLISFVVDNFEMPAKVNEESYKGQMVVLFEVTKDGDFKVLHTEAVYQELKDEVSTVFGKLPKIKPATYNSEATYMQFTMPIKIPLSRNVIDNFDIADKTQSTTTSTKMKPGTEVNPMQEEYDRIQNETFEPSNAYTSQLNIPFSHQVYSRFDAQLNALGTNSHTGSKPYLYSTVNPYYDFETKASALSKNKSSWLGRKFFDEHMVRIQGEGYWFTLDPAADLQVGYETDELKEDAYTYNNTRAVFVQGGLGKKLNFFAAVYESQGRFAEYFNDLARSIAPDGGNPGIIPGRGIAKEGRNGDFDYPAAEGYVSYSPIKMFNIQLGHGKQFIGDGYRSLLLSDNSSYFPYIKLNTSFWKIKYTNTWTSLRDVRPEVTEDGSFRAKYMANHYLSYNVSKRLNIGLFESVIWENDNGRGFDFNYLNPIIFFRAIEFSTGSRGGNALIGLTGKYKFSSNINAYAQVVIDEFSGADVFGGNKSYKNKQGFQVGAKYYNAFKVPNLTLQLEYNQVRPYVYSNNEIQLNYGHNNQSLAHQWGANFKEAIAIARYEHKRWYGSAKVVIGSRGAEIGDITDVYYGGSIYGSDENRPSDEGIEFFQGNKVDSFYADIELGYLLNPATNLKVYVNPIYRDFKAATQTTTTFDTNTLWVNVGFRTDLFNWYYDY